MKVFIDLEFTGLHKDTQIISLGLKTEDNRTFYAEFNDYYLEKCNANDKEWLKDNVISNLMFNNVNTVVPDYCVYDSDYIRVKGNTEEIRAYLNVFFKSIKEQVVLVGDCMSYDIVLFNSIFGHSFNIPENIFYIPIDICTMMVDRGIDPDIKRSLIVSKDAIDEQHNALYDATIIKEWYDRMIECDTQIDPDWYSKLKDLDKGVVHSE